MSRRLSLADGIWICDGGPRQHQRQRGAGQEGDRHHRCDMASNYLSSLPPDRFPNLVDLAEHFAITDPDERFELLLDLFVDGLAQRAARQ